VVSIHFALEAVERLVARTYSRAATPKTFVIGDVER
jgi:hypothetical protein